MVLPRYQREANKRFFLETLNKLMNNGFYCWTDEMEFFTKKGNKFEATAETIEKVGAITDDAFVRRYFVVKR